MPEDNCIEISRKIMRNQSFPTKRDKAIKLSEEDIDFIKTLAAMEFKTGKNQLKPYETRILRELCLLNHLFHNSYQTVNRAAVKLVHNFFYAFFKAFFRYNSDFCRIIRFNPFL